MSDLGIKRSLRELLPKGEAKEISRVISYDEGGHRGPVGTGTRFRPKRIPWKIPAIIIIILVLGGSGYVFSQSFATATVTVTPKENVVAVDGNMSASRGGINASTTLSFETFTFEDMESAMVPSTGTQNVERKASGKITVYNDFSEKPERLIANTRFETPDGKIYRIPDAIVIPGKRSSGEESVPGSVEVTVNADQPGDTYTIGTVNFTVPGLKGDARFSKIYAKSKTDMTGGFVGRTRVVAEADRARVRTGSQSTLSARLEKKAKAELPAEFISFPDGQFTSFTEDIGEKSSETEAELRINGSMTVIALKRADLARAIAEAGIPDYDGSPVDLVNPDALEIRILSKDSVNPGGSADFSFSIRGNTSIVYTFDEGELKTRLAGKTKRDYGSVFAAYPSIKRAEVSFSPSWVGNFPTDKEKIFIEHARGS